MDFNLLEVFKCDEIIPAFRYFILVVAKPSNQFIYFILLALNLISHDVDDIASLRFLCISLARSSITFVLIISAAVPVNFPLFFRYRALFFTLGPLTPLIPFTVHRAANIVA